MTIALRDFEARGVHRREDGSWLLTEAAKRMVEAIAGQPPVAQSLGERLMLYRQISGDEGADPGVTRRGQADPLATSSAPVTNG